VCQQNNFAQTGTGTQKAIKVRVKPLEKYRQWLESRPKQQPRDAKQVLLNQKTPFLWTLCSLLVWLQINGNIQQINGSSIWYNYSSLSCLDLSLNRPKVLKIATNNFIEANISPNGPFATAKFNSDKNVERAHCDKQHLKIMVRLSVVLPSQSTHLFKINLQSTALRILAG
jgi:hypothetical protein